MTAPDGRAVKIPYSKVHMMIQNDYLFQDKPTLQQYSRDLAADPLSEDRIDQFLDKHPWIAAPVHAIEGVGTGVAKTATGLDKTPTTKLETYAQMAAAKPVKGMAGGAGELGENVLEYFGGEELLGLLGKGAEALPLAERLKSMTNMAQLLAKYPTLAKVAKIGTTAVKQGTIAAGQTFAKTGGDVGAATRAGLETAVAGPLLEGAAVPAGKLAGKLLPKAEEAVPGTAEYAAQARGAAEPSLRNVNEAVEATRGEPGAALAKRGAITAPGAAAAVPKAAPLDVDAVLNQIHDFTGAADRLAEVNDAGYSALDKITGGRFRELNAEVAAAQKGAYAGKEGAEELYKSKLAEMDALIDGTQGISRDTVQALKQSWRQSYQLRDFGDIWDRNLNGVPGATQASQVQRGINGKGLMRGLQQAVRNYGRPNIEQALGPGRLENLEEIARLNQTDAKRAVFNRGLHEVATYLPTYLGWRMGEYAGGIGGGVAGAAAGAMLKPAMVKTLAAVRSNPRIGQFFTSAIEMGARPEVYGPMLAEMIQRSETEASLQRQAHETKEEGDQP